MKKFIEYIDEILTLLQLEMETRPVKDSNRLQRGLAHLRGISQHPEGSATVTIYRASGQKLLS